MGLCPLWESTCKFCPHARPITAGGMPDPVPFWPRVAKGAGTSACWTHGSVVLLLPVPDHGPTILSMYYYMIGRMFDCLDPLFPIRDVPCSNPSIHVRLQRLRDDPEKKPYRSIDGPAILKQCCFFCYFVNRRLHQDRASYYSKGRAWRFVLWTELCAVALALDSALEAYVARYGKLWDF